MRSLILDLVELVVLLALVGEILLEWLARGSKSILLRLERWFEVLGPSQLELALLVLLLILHRIAGVVGRVLRDTRIVRVL